MTNHEQLAKKWLREYRMAPELEAWAHKAVHLQARERHEYEWGDWSQFGSGEPDAFQTYIIVNILKGLANSDDPDLVHSMVLEHVTTITDQLFQKIMKATKERAFELNSQEGK